MQRKENDGRKKLGKGDNWKDKTRSKKYNQEDLIEKNMT